MARMTRKIMRSLVVLFALLLSVQSAQARPKWITFCTNALSSFNLFGSKHLVSQGGMEDAVKRGYRIVEVNDSEFASTIGEPMSKAQYSSLECTRESWIRQFEALLRAGFGFEPFYFKYGSESSRTEVVEEGLLFRSGMGWDKNSVSAILGGELMAVVNGKEALFQLDISAEGHDRLVAAASKLSKEQGLLERFLSKGARYRVEFGGDPIFAKFMNKGGPLYRYSHEIKVPREVLTVFANELERVYFSLTPQ